jgi:8-oxo-dGTP pyrophosphatase MutT (NUDIX family)
MSKAVRSILPRDVHGWAGLVTEALAIPYDAVLIPSHFVLRELHTGKVKSFATNVSLPNESAVLLLLNPVQDRAGIASDVADVCIPLTMRSSKMRTHKGQISLPGGRCDKGETAVIAACRETKEEIGVDPGAYVTLGELRKVYSYPSKSWVTPVVAIAESELHPTVASPDEVESLHYLHLSQLLESSEQTHFTLAKKFSTSSTGNVSFPCFFASSCVETANSPWTRHPQPLDRTVLTPVCCADCDGALVWGLTAFILCEFISRLAMVLERRAGLGSLTLLRPSPWIVRDPDHPLNLEAIPAAHL